MKSISCKDAVTLILQKEERKLSLWSKMKLWRHLAICSLCRIFAIQNNLLNEGMKERQGKQLALSDEEKEKIIQNILEQKKN
jgi:hypothetical protein